MSKELEREDEEMARVRISRQSWEKVVRYKVDNAWELGVTGIKCSRCGMDVKGTLFLDKKTLTVADSWGFMVFSDEIVCDVCLGEGDGTLVIEPVEEN